jgi:hypothetical protein
METGVERLEGRVPFLHNSGVTDKTLTEIMEKIGYGVDGIVIGG